MNLKHVLGIIPARSGSKGIPGKNMRPLAGIPLVSRACRTALESRLLTQVVLSTDSEDIAKLGREQGVLVPFLRPAKFAADDSPATDYVRHSLDVFTERFTRPDIMVILQPTTPFRQSRDIDACIELLESSDADCVVSVCRVPGHFNPAWQLQINEDGELQTFQGDGLGKLQPRRQDLTDGVYRNGAVYAFYTKVFEETGTLFGSRCLAYEMDAVHSVNIDDPLDWLLAEAVAQNLDAEGAL